jgi:hypothetical protein
MSEEKAGEGLSAEERRLLISLSGGKGASKAPAPADARAENRNPVRVISNAGELSTEEEKVRARAREESGRLGGEGLRRMFERGRPGHVIDVPEDAEFLEGGEARRASPGLSRAGEIIAAPLDWVNYPFSRMSQAWRLGLGLCGVFLLMTLLLVMLVRTIVGS